MGQSEEPGAAQPAVQAVMPGLEPFVSVVVPVRDGLDALRGCVIALLSQDYPVEAYEVIVVDNGSATTPTAVLPVDARLIVVDEPTRGSYRARNAGVRLARGEILAFTDADCVPAADWLRVSVEHLLAHPETAMIGGRVEITFPRGSAHSPPEWFEFIEGFPQERYIGTGFAVTANMVTRRSVIDWVGGFDDSMLSGGDAEWGRRVRAAGGAQSYVPDAVVWHPARNTWAELRDKTARTTVGVLRRFWAGSHPRASLLRILLAQPYRSVTAPFVVWHEPRLPSTSARFSYLRARWLVDGVIAATVLRALLGPRPKR